MIGRIIEVADDRRHLFAHRGFLVVKQPGGDPEELGRVPLDDINAVIANAHGLSYTNNLLIRLAERGIPMAICANNHQAVAILWAINGHHLQGKRFDAQLASTRPTRKRIWAAVVRAKLGHQAAVLEALGKPGAPLRALSKRVRSGDPDNLEAQGARRYWPLLFGEEFRRDREQQGINAMLNYGYTVLRAATARAVIAAGLHPTLGIHHQNEANSMRLVDDLMEPFRPYIDYTIWRLAQSTLDMELDRSAKTAIVRALFIELETDAGATPIQVCLQRLATSLAQVFTGEQAGLDLPKPSPSRLA